VKSPFPRHSSTTTDIFKYVTKLEGFFSLKKNFAINFKHMYFQEGWQLQKAEHNIRTAMVKHKKHAKS
jgi:hypothetical protein